MASVSVNEARVLTEATSISSTHTTTTYATCTGACATWSSLEAYAGNHDTWNTCTVAQTSSVTTGSAAPVSQTVTPRKLRHGTLTHYAEAVAT
jgi:hypothetical protein